MASGGNSQGQKIQDRTIEFDPGSLNAGGMPYTCKSNGNRSSDADEWRTGE